MKVRKRQHTAKRKANPEQVWSQMWREEAEMQRKQRRMRKVADAEIKRACQQ